MGADPLADAAAPPAGEIDWICEWTGTLCPPFSST
jgi:hypothetical protein